MTAFLDRDLAVLRKVPRRAVPRSKLTPEQVVEIRRRVDSLSVPWTIRDLAAEFGVTVAHMTHIARREKWDEPAFEPEQREWWHRRHWREERARLRELRR